MVGILRPLLLMLVTGFLGRFADEANGQQPQSHQIYIRNLSDRPVRVFFMHADICKSFCVVRLNESAQALIENVPPGHWFATVFELVRKDAWGGAGVRLGPAMPGKIVRISGSDGITVE